VGDYAAKTIVSSSAQRGRLTAPYSEIADRALLMSAIGFSCSAPSACDQTRTVLSSDPVTAQRPSRSAAARQMAPPGRPPRAR
jgi:hypothetical protein